MPRPSITLILPVSKSLSNLLGGFKMYKDKKRYMKALKNYELLPFCKKYKDYKKRLIFQRFSPYILDVDNYHGGCKKITDALKTKGFLIDDKPKYCEMVWLDQVKCKKIEQKTVVTIEVIE